MRKVHSKTESLIRVAVILSAIALSSGQISLAPNSPGDTAQEARETESIVLSRTADNPDATEPVSGHETDHETGPATESAAASSEPTQSPIAALEHEGRGPTLRRALEETLEIVSEAQPVDLRPRVLDAITRDGSVRILFSVLPDEIRATQAGPALARWTARTQTTESLRVFPRLPFAAATVDGDGLIELIATGATDHIELDAIHRPTLDSSVPIITADLLHDDGFDGDGFAVAVLDTGIDLTHPMYTDRLIEEACFSLLGSCPNNQSQMLGPGSAAPCPIGGCGHGTSVTGIAVGRDPGNGLRGVAPNANLIAIQIFSVIGSSPGAYSSDIVAALQHVLGLAAFHDIASVNLSLGGNTFSTASDCDLSGRAQYWAIEALRNVGIVVVAASGNDAETDQIASPGCLSNVLSVGAIRDDGTIPNFSNSANFLSVLAPGQSIESSAVGGGTSYVSGTSMATPHVAGAIAALREAYPDASASEVENALQLSGVPILDPRNGLAVPRIDAFAAETLLATLPPSSPGGGGQPVPATGSGGANPAAASAGGGGGGGCGLVGIEPFLALGAIRGARWQRRRRGMVKG